MQQTERRIFQTTCRSNGDVYDRRFSTLETVPGNALAYARTVLHCFGGPGEFVFPEGQVAILPHYKSGLPKTPGVTLWLSRLDGGTALASVAPCPREEGPITNEELLPNVMTAALLHGPGDERKAVGLLKGVMLSVLANQGREANLEMLDVLREPGTRPHMVGCAWGCPEHHPLVKRGSDLLTLLCAALAFPE